MAKYIDYSDLRARIPPLDEIMRTRYGINLQRKGKELKGLCPFHNDHDPSMGVTLERGGVWYCPVCGEGGGVLRFVQRKENLPDCRAAAELLDAVYLGGELASRTIPTAEETQKRQDRNSQTREAWERGKEILSGMVKDREFLGDEQGADELREILKGAAYDFDDTENSCEFLRAVITTYGGDCSEMDAITPTRNLKPSDFSDIAEGRLFASEYGDRVLYNPILGWMVYDGARWVSNEAQAREYAHELTDRQLDEAKEALLESVRQRADAATGTAAEMDRAEKSGKAAEAYQKYVIKQRDTRKITATMTEAKPRLNVETDEIDTHRLFLNTPRGTINLATGKMKPHDSRDLLTTVTAFSPSDEGREEWERFVLEIADGDKDLAAYLKIVCGMCVCGEVRDQVLIIANGRGGNGKSTFFKAISDVLKDYSETMDANTMLQQEGQQKRFELADLRGKRLMVAGETDEGKHLDAAVVKKVCSIDRIKGERKYKDSFTFEPTHHLVMFTNFLPIVDSNDNGTWDRLLILPFTATFRNTAEEKMNLALSLSERCGGAILKWCIEGAGEYLRLNKLPTPPEVVRAATEEYRSRHDRLFLWMRDECETGRKFSASTTDLLTAFNEYAEGHGEDTISAKVFASQLTSKGFTISHKKSGNFANGIKLKK